MNGILGLLAALTPAEITLIIGQTLTFLGIALTAVAQIVNARRTAKVEGGLNEIKVDINGRLDALVEAVGGRREAEGYQKGKMAERADPHVSASSLTVKSGLLARGERGEAGEKGERGERGERGEKGDGPPR